MQKDTLDYSTEAIDRIVNSLKSLAQGVDDDFAKGISLFGAGMVGEWAVGYLQKQGAVVRSFLDNDPRKNGTSVSGIKVSLPEEAAVDGVDSVLITARHYVREISTQLSGKFTNLISFDAYFIVQNYSRIANVRDSLLEDEKSRVVFNAILHSMLTSSLDACYEVVEKHMYFSLPQFSGNFEETYVDAGAFVGDSMESFIWENLGTFGHLYAFEPGERQFAALQARTKRLVTEWAIDPAKISLEKAGLSDSNTELSCTYVTEDALRHGLSASGADSGSARVPVYTLDSYLNGRKATFLKVDIEGMEMAFLRGARETICNHRPKIAICIYHYPSDLYEIIEFLQDLSLGYKFSVRWHAPVFGDFVLYCY